MIQETLSIRLSTDGFSFSIFNPAIRTEPAVTPYSINESLSLTANLKQAFKELPWLNDTYRRVNVLMAGSRFTLMPLDLFDDELSADFFYLNHPPVDNEAVRYNILQKNNTVVLFGIDKSVMHLVDEHYPQVQIYSHVSPLIEYFTAKSWLGNNRKIYAYFRPHAIEVFAYERGRLKLANSYRCRLCPDRLYFLLLAWKTLEFDPERDELHLCGELSEKEELLCELRKYLRQVFIMNPNLNIDLQAITICE